MSTASRPKRPIRRGLRRALRRSYRLSRLEYTRRLHRGGALGPDRLPVLVYQMGKVGSRSLCQALEARSDRLSVLHLHVLTAESMARVEAIARRRWDGRPRCRHVWTSRYVAAHLGARDRPWTVITLVRDPVARNVSSFFQVLELEHGIDVTEKLRAASPEAVARELLPVFLRDFDHDTPLVFLEREIGTVFGVEILGDPDAAGRGFRVYSSDAADVLLLRFEDLDRCVGPAMEAFLGLSDVRLEPRNVGDQKDYGSVYRAFRRQAALPDAYLDRMYGSRYARTFYTADELAGLRDYWAGRPRSPRPRPAAGACGGLP